MSRKQNKLVRIVAISDLIILRKIDIWYLFIADFEKEPSPLAPKC